MSILHKKQEIEDLITPTAKNLDYKIVDIAVFKNGKNSVTLKIVIDRLDGSKIKVSDCQTFSKMISPVLDVEGLIRERYYLEVESAGVEKRLRNIDDFIAFINHQIVVKLINPINDVKKYEGVILGVEQQQITLRLQSGNIIAIDYDNIKAANTVFTDEMFRQITKNY